MYLEINFSSHLDFILNKGDVRSRVVTASDNSVVVVFIKPLLQQETTGYVEVFITRNFSSYLDLIQNKGM